MLKQRVVLGDSRKNSFAHYFLAMEIARGICQASDNKLKAIPFLLAIPRLAFPKQ